MDVELAEGLKPLAEFRREVKFGDRVRIELDGKKPYVGFSWGGSVDLAALGYRPPKHLCDADIILGSSNFSPIRDTTKERLSILRLKDRTLDGVRVLGYSVLSRARAVVDF